MFVEDSGITISSAEPSQGGLIVYFSDGTTTLFQNHFLYEMREHNGNVALTDMSEDDLMNALDSNPTD